MTFLISFFPLLFLCFLFHALSTCVWPRVKGKVAACDLAKLRSFFNRVLIFLAQLVGCVCLLSLWDTFQYGWCTQFGTVLSNFVFNRLPIFRAQLVISGLLSPWGIHLNILDRQVLVMHYKSNVGELLFREISIGKFNLQVSFF